MVLINDTYETEKQIDRACSAQSPELLPKDKVNVDKLKEAQERLTKEKSQYKVPVSVLWQHDQTF